MASKGDQVKEEEAGETLAPTHEKRPRDPTLSSPESATPRPMNKRLKSWNNGPKTLTPKTEESRVKPALKKHREAGEEAEAEATSTRAGFNKTR